MALKSAPFNELPKGVKAITKDEAIDFQLGIIETFCPPNKRIFIKTGKLLTSTACAISCIYFQSYYRQTVNVLFHGRIYSLAPAVLIPAFSNLALHNGLITENILVQKWACPACYHIRSGLLNVACGVIYPLIIAPVVAFSYARRLKTCEVPPLNNKKIWNFYLDRTRPLRGRIGVFALLHFMIGAAVVHFEAMENNDFNLNINKYINAFVERQAMEKANLQKKETHSEK